MLTNRLIRYFSSNKVYKIPVVSPQMHLLDNFKVSTEIETTSSEALQYYRELIAMRQMEIFSDKLYKNKEIFGFCHLYDGQEAVALGIETALTKQDPLITAYRDHCQAYLRGISIYQIFAEMLGKADGSSKGKGGSMHYYNSKENFYGGNGIVGAQIPVGTGLAFALNYNGNPNKNVAVALYGDGAANQGQLYEAANMAALWKLPMLFVCENNRYSMGTSVERHSAGGHDFHKKVYSVPGIRFDGMCVYTIKNAFQFAKEYSVENGPLMISIDTYRYHGHSMSDPGITYRNSEEVQGVRKSMDCIKNLQKVILEHEMATIDELKAIEKEVKNEVSQSVKKAQQAPIVSTSELTTDIYANPKNHYVRAANYEDSLFIKESLIN